MPITTPPTVCVLCHTKLVKNGKNSAGNQRWRCPDCGHSTLRKRPDRSHHFQLERFLTWLLGKASQAELTHTKTGRTFRRNIEWCWRIIPALPTVRIPPKFVIIDGTYFGGWCLLIVTDDHQRPLARQWCSTESQAAWTALLHQIPAPLVVVCDGGAGVRAALREVWPDTLVQRCIFHVLMNVRTHLTLRPRTTAGQTLLELSRRLGRVTNTEEAIGWLQQLNAWHTVYGSLTTERSYARRKLKSGLWDSPTGKQWWYTHDRLRKAYNLLAELQRRGQLFTYLETGSPKTTSQLEGGVNSILKNTLRLHRGMPVEHQRRAAEWVLLDLAGLLHTASGMITDTVINPPQKTKPRFTDPDPGPVTYDTGLSAEEGLWTRTGWGGRG